MRPDHERVRRARGAPARLTCHSERRRPPRTGVGLTHRPFHEDGPGHDRPTASQTRRPRFDRNDSRSRVSHHLTTRVHAAVEAVAEPLAGANRRRSTASMRSRNWSYRRSELQRTPFGSAVTPTFRPRSQGLRQAGRSSVHGDYQHCFIIARCLWAELPARVVHSRRAVAAG